MQWRLSMIFCGETWECFQVGEQWLVTLTGAAWRSAFLLPFSGKCWWCMSEPSVSVSWPCSEGHTKEAGAGRRCGFTLLLYFCFLGGQRSGFSVKWKQLHSTPLHLRKWSWNLVWIFLSKASKINWISGEKPDARLKDGEYSVGIVKLLPWCKEIASTD